MHFGVCEEIHLQYLFLRLVIDPELSTKLAGKLGRRKWIDDRYNIHLPASLNPMELLALWIAEVVLFLYLPCF